MESASCSGHATHCGGVASGRLSAVLEMALPSPAGRWPKAGGQGDSGADRSYGCGEPDVGSTQDSRRAAEAGLPRVGANSLSLASTNAENSRSGPALANVSAEPSRGHCRDGLLHGTDPHVWRPVLLLLIGHDRRKILRYNVTRNPSALWIVQQMREAWPYAPAHRFLLFDRDAKFGSD